MSTSFLLKPAIILALACVLMVPVAMIRGLVDERQARRNEAVTGIAEGWGKRQVLAGPYLAIPYERQWTEVSRDKVDGKPRETRTERREAGVIRLQAANVEWSADAEISEKARGIYRARLYSTQLRARGLIDVPARASFEDGRSQYRWFAPRLVLGISDPLGIRVASGVSLGGAAYGFAPGPGDAALPTGLHAPVPDVQLEKPQSLAFSLAIELGGSEALSIAPLGADTIVTMRANWPHPSFQGRFLPARHEIGPGGFTASWKVSRFAAQGAAQSAKCSFPCNGMNEQITVSFIEPTGLYPQLERASKYGFLFLGLTFAAFLLLEMLRRLAIHPMQYALVGLALAIFFLLLTALSEHIDFAAAYAIATIACVGLISAYLMRVLRSARAGLAFGAALAALYAALYATLKAEDYALLGGALLLFGLLAAVMIATRRVDWYALTARNETRRAPA